MKRTSDWVRLSAMLLVLLSATSLLAQSPGEAPTTEDSGASLSSSSQLDDERAKVWNSPEMLEARAYLETLFKRSARITPEQAEKYMADLKSKSPDDMRIWLIQFQEQLAQRQQESDRARQLRQQAALGELPAQRMGAFTNPFAGQSTPPTGLPVSGLQPTQGGVTNVFEVRPPIQKPFSSPEYARSIRPLVTSQDAARYEILRGLGPGVIF